MQRIALRTSSTLALLVAGMLAVAPALADKPSWAGEGKGKGGKHQQEDRQDSGREQERGHDGRSSRDGGSRGERHGDGDSRGERHGRHFDDRRRVVVHEYYAEQFRHGHRCPPGLAKKHNGCMPPGQARHWNVGRPLPRDVVYYSVPPAVVVQIGAPPAGHRYVRVASDILLIAVGTGIVVDAIQNLGRL